jgi:lipid-A-disaccharide synthase
MKYYIITGEASGDLHASNLMRSLKQKDPNAQFRVWGGELMENQGGVLVKHYRDLAFMGFGEVIANLPTILKNMRLCQADLTKWRPDVLILVDYPGFNLRIANFAFFQNIRTFYYISPQVWAWKKSRVKKIRKFVERMYVILPFEKDFYHKYGVDVDFVGHPLLDVIENEKRFLHSPADFRQKHNLDKRLIIAVLPGSRKQEILKMLPVMLSAAGRFTNYQFVVAGAPSLEEQFYKKAAGDVDFKIIFGATHDLLHNAFAGLITSGTATLETALLEVPQVVCYKGSFFSYQIAKRIVNIDYISLVNLIMDREVVTELIQSAMNTQNIYRELEKVLDFRHRKPILNDYDELRQKLGGAGASSTAAELMFQRLNRTKNQNH